MMVLAVTLHNIPEGMAVGVIYAGLLAGNMQRSASGCACFITWNCNSEFPGRSNYISAA